jgi:drug/metabolite transporter (DMT)-like permease
MRKAVLEYWWLIALSIVAGVAGQATIKLGVGQPQAAADGLVGLVTMILHSPLVLLGLFLYGIGALAWIAVLSRMDLSYAYPFLALNFVLVTLVAQVGLGEVVPTLRWFGVGIICAGVLVVARSAF